MQAVSARAESERMDATLTFELSYANGESEQRTARVIRHVDTGYRKVAMYFSEPRTLRGSAFLAWNADAAEVEDEQWLYLPALRRVRRIPSRDRGQAFLGTELSYGDISQAAKLELGDWVFTSAEPLQGAIWVVQGKVITQAVAQDIGYSRGRWTVDIDRAFPIRSEYWDTQGEPLKVVEYRQIVERDGALSADLIEVHNLKSDDKTRMAFSNVSVNAQAQDQPELLSPARLSHGP
ncbi:MAG: outer membrane lipoprotein-sorting protein [Panacagrimonas sp.]